MSKKWPLIFTVGLCISLLAAFAWPVRKSATEMALAHYRADVAHFRMQTTLLVKLIEQNRGGPQIQQQFKAARLAYKKTEWLAEYYHSYTAKSINGPAVAEVDAEDKNVVLQPEGFQVIETLLFPKFDGAQKELLLQQARILQSNAGRLQQVSTLLQTTDAHIFDALRLEVFRILALGITGFDSPIAHNSLEESAAALVSVQHYYSYFEHRVKENDPECNRQIRELFQTAQAMLKTAPDFNRLDRTRLIRSCLNPLSEKLASAQQLIHLPFFSEPRAFRASTASLFAPDAFNVFSYAPNTKMSSHRLQTALGRRLFYNRQLSGNGQRSCATCHQKELAFTDGRSLAKDIHGKDLSRNTPSLLNAALQPALFLDGRITYLEDLIREVIGNKKEMNGSLSLAASRINKSKEYREMFAEAYGTAATPASISNALASYIRSLTGLNSRFDHFMRGDLKAMNRTEIDGFNLFSGKAKCATCHFLPLFNGSLPPLFDHSESEVLGVPDRASAVKAKAILDSDWGRFNTDHIELHKHAFKTPTLRNVALTAPYMHNGAYRSLEEVIEFYNCGGGAGLGLGIPNQSLPQEPLHLSAYEKMALVAFLKTLSDTSGLH